MDHRLEDGILVLHCRDDLTLAEAMVGLQRALDDHPGARHVPLLICDTESDFLPTAADCPQLARGLLRAVPQISTRIALVVARDVKFGIGRQVGAHCDELGLEFRVFRCRQAAEQWLQRTALAAFSANSALS